MPARWWSRRSTGPVTCRQPPVVVASGAYRAGPRPGLDIGDHLLWADYSRNYTQPRCADLFGRAGIWPGDVQVAEIYDCFTSTVLIGLEGLGLCRAGRVRGIRPPGATPGSAAHCRPTPTADCCPRATSTG